MDTAPTLTPAEVIDRVRAARRAEQDAAFAQLELAVSRVKPQGPDAVPMPRVGGPRAAVIPPLP